MAEVSSRMLVRDVMNSPVVTSDPDERVDELARLMRDKEVGSVIILNGERPVGIVTDGDIVRKVVASNIRPSSLKAKDIMSSPLLVIEGDKEITLAVKIMRGNNLKHLGVVYKNRLVGIVTISDIAYVTPELLSILFEKSLIEKGGFGYRGRYSGYCDICGQWSDDLVEIDNRFVCKECRIEHSMEI